MSEFGKNLTEKRLARGITLQQISEETNISIKFLLAIENECFQLLPGGMFNTSFVRQYADSICLDPDRTVEEFHKIYTYTGLSREDYFGMGVEMGTRQLVFARFSEACVSFFRQHRGFLSTLGLACLLFALGLGLYAIRPHDRVDFVATETADYAMGLKGVTPTTPKVSDAVARSVTHPIEVEIEIVEVVWIRVISDGRRILERTLRPGGVHLIRARKSVQLLVGNAGGVSIALNGKSQPPIGARGQVRRVVLTPSGMEVVAPPASRHVTRAKVTTGFSQGSPSSTQVMHVPAED